MFDALAQGYLYFAILFLIGVNVTYCVLLVRSLREMLSYIRHNSFRDLRISVQSEFAPGVSILLPVYNEGATVVDSVRSLLSISYGRFEVIVINDGSNDETLTRMTEQLGLHLSDRVYVPALRTKEVQTIYRSNLPEFKDLVVIDKEHGGEADALNAGINLARYELVCATSPKAILEDDALQKAVKPFLEDGQVIAAGGIMRVLNGCEIINGRVASVGLPRNILPLFQIVEYFRTFLSGRMAWHGLNALLFIPGEFGLFRRQVLLDIGGYRTDIVHDDMELIVRIHRNMIERRKSYRIVFIPEPVCWTEVPEYLWLLARQRTRSYRGVVEVVRSHWKMLFNGQYGMVGRGALPYLLLVEMLGPVVEMFGYAMAAFMLFGGVEGLELAGMFLVVSILYGTLFSVGSVLLEEISFRRYANPRALMVLIAMGVLESFGYRQLTAWWRVQALFGLSGGKQEQRKPQRAEVVEAPLEL